MRPSPYTNTSCQNRNRILVRATTHSSSGVDTPPAYSVYNSTDHMNSEYAKKGRVSGDINFIIPLVDSGLDRFVRCGSTHVSEHRKCCRRLVQHSKRMENLVIRARCYAYQHYVVMLIFSYGKSVQVSDEV